MDGLWATKSEGVGLIDRAISFQDFQPICDPDPPTLQTDRQTDGRTTCNLNTALCTSALRGKKRAVVGKWHDAVVKFRHTCRNLALDIT